MGISEFIISCAIARAMSPQALASTASSSPATLAALVIALLTVSAHSYLVARANRANALRYE